MPMFFFIYNILDLDSRFYLLVKLWVLDSGFDNWDVSLKVKSKQYCEEVLRLQVTTLSVALWLQDSAYMPTCLVSVVWCHC